MARYSVGRARTLRAVVTAAVLSVALAIPGAAAPQEADSARALSSTAPGAATFTGPSGYGDWCPELLDGATDPIDRRIPINPAGPGSGLPELPCGPLDTRGQQPSNLWFDSGIRTDAVSAVDRAKLEIRLPRQTLRLYAAVCFGTGFTGWTTPGCDSVAERNGWTLPPGFIAMNGQSADSWVESPPGAPLEFGTFPPVHVRTVAFGNVPAEATAHITQTVTNGLVDPMTYQWMTSVVGVPQGTLIPGYEELGPRPEGKREWAFPSVIEGRVRIRLSNVRVDGVPVEVGSKCSTTPTTLSLYNPPGWFDHIAQGAGEIPPGEPGAFYATGATAEGNATISGTIDIPPFRGCGIGGEDLDPLMTALVAGPDNPVIATVARVLGPWCVDGVVPRDDPRELYRGQCPLEDYDGWPISSSSRAAQRGSVDPLADIPRWIRDKWGPGELREIRRVLSASY